jgi:hypothetical protein
LEQWFGQCGKQEGWQNSCLANLKAICISLVGLAWKVLKFVMDTNYVLFGKVMWAKSVMWWIKVLFSNCLVK